jgi:lipoprotein-anchoring transpeptidase ErfK/SrfK
MAEGAERRAFGHSTAPRPEGRARPGLRLRQRLRLLTAAVDVALAAVWPIPQRRANGRHRKTAPLRWRVAAATAAVAVAVGGAGVGFVLSADRAATSAGQAGAPGGTAVSLAPVTITQVATVRKAAPKYASPGRRERGTVPVTWFGRPSILPVIATRPGWVRIRLAQRPDGSTAWLPAADVSLGSTPYRIVIDLADTHLQLYDRGREILNAPAGVGTVDDPTPTGEFFVAFVEPPPEPNPGYGPFIMVTSDHSKTIADWEGSGDAVIGIHGPLGASQQIGTTGARVSHGCIRLQDRALVKLRPVPPGTPIDVIS